MAARLSANGKPLGRPPKTPAAPAPAANPAAIKKVMSVMARYDAAGRGRKMAGWNPPSTGPNTALGDTAKLRSRAQDSVRNDWASGSGAQKWTTTLIGIGITPRFRRITSVERRKEVTDLFNQFSRQIDADCVLDYFGQQTLAVRSWFTDGEVFGRFRARYTDEGLAVPMQVQLLESAMVPNLDVLTSGAWQGLPANHVIRSGIELDKRGKRVAYWVYKQHPDDLPPTFTPAASMFVRVAASEMIHMFELKRPGQLRGVSELANILVRLRDTADYEDAVLTRQKIANLFVAFIKRTLPTLDPNDPVYGALTGAAAEFAQTGVGPADDVDGVPLLPMAPGLMQELEDGQDVTFANPPEAGTNYSDYLRTQGLGTAAGMGLPYELHSGDIREISDRTLRVVIQEFRRLAQQRQWQMVIPMFCQRVVEWFADSAALIGALSLEEAALVKLVEHSPHGWEYIHPVQDPQGKQIEVDAGFRSRSSVIAERGDDPDQVDAERKIDKEREDELGLTPPPPTAGGPGGDPEDDPDEQQGQQP